MKGMDARRGLTILHVDMDAFYAAIEQLDRPELKGKPVIVGAPPDRRGVVSTCSYEARVLGVHSAMPSRTAGKLCPQGIFLPPRMKRYEEMSKVIMEVFHEFTPLVEPLSLDEAFLDVAGGLWRWGDAIAIAMEVKKRIVVKTGGLTASVGVAPNKFLAKVASDMNKPDGLTVVPADGPGILGFLGPLPVGKLWGVGKVSGERLARAGIRTIGQLQTMGMEELECHFGKTGARDMWALCRGIDERAVETELEEKSVSGEYTFDRDCADMDRVRQVLLEQVERVGRRLRTAGKMGRTAHIKVRFSDFRTITRQVGLPVPVNSDRDLRDAAFKLFDSEEVRQAVRLIGFGVTGLTGTGVLAEESQLLLPEVGNAPMDKRNAAIDRAVDSLRITFGSDIVRRGNWKITPE